jgi:biopolymer transport protein ExbB/TolQ
MGFFSEIAKAFQLSEYGFIFMWALAALLCAVVAFGIERWLAIGRLGDINAASFILKVRRLLGNNQLNEAIALCKLGAPRFLPDVVLAALTMYKRQPALVLNAIEEKTVTSIPLLEKRLNFLATFGNMATLIGLTGTIWGLIKSFAAVAMPGVEPAAKSSMLASGISTAMNTTLLGLMIAIPTILFYNVLKTKVERIIHEVDKFSVTVYKVLTPGEIVNRTYRSFTKRSAQEVDTEPVILIPLLLTQAEFIKVGSITMNLPPASTGDIGEDDEKIPPKSLDLGLVVTKKGINFYSFFTPPPETTDIDAPPQIPLKGDGRYDYYELTVRLTDVKIKVLREILEKFYPGETGSMNLVKLAKSMEKVNQSALYDFKDFESIKIAATKDINYQTMVALMDASRSARRAVTRDRTVEVPLFPIVSLAGEVK